MKIQPITTWFNGEPQTATNFTLISINDNFTTSAVLYYELQKEIVNEESVSYENLITATLDISGQDYKDWSVEPDANTWIYNWAAGKLNLVLVTE
jgi:C4-type Zn-finger protein